MRTLNARLSAALLVLLLVLGTVTVALTLWTSRLHMQEAQQKLHRDLATHIVEEQPLLADRAASKAVLGDVFEKLMVINPDLEIYLLDLEGNILAYSAPPGRVQLARVSLAPILTFLEPDARLPILGTDPRSPGSSNIFSAAPIRRDAQLVGYLYIVLASEQLGSAADMLEASYILRAGTSMVAGSLLVAMAGGLLIFRGLTRRLRELTGEMADFETQVLSQRRGDHGSVAPPPVAGGPPPSSDTGDADEIDRLARGFRGMAEQISRHLGELEKQDEERRALLANISHDVRTPLTHLQGYLETLLMRGESLSAEERREYLQIATQRSEQLGRLVADLFELAKLDAPAEHLDKEPVPIAELVQDVAQEFRLAAAGRDIVLDAHVGETPLLVNGNLGVIERVLQNLIENALRHTRSGDRITVAVACEGDTVRVSVGDSGPGIPPDDLPHIFDRFYHRSPRRGRNTESSGLGLAIAKRGLELHGSDLVCESEVDVGTTFRFELSSLGAGA